MNEWGDDYDRDDEVQELREDYDRAELERIRDEMRELADDTDDEREQGLLEYRIKLVEDALE